VIRIVEALLAAQKIQLQNRTLTAEQQSECQRLCQNVPVAVREKFDRLISRGKKAVATVRNGVCSECHLRLPSGTLASLAYTTEIHCCNNCGRFLYLAEQQPPSLETPAMSPAKAPVKRTGRRTRRHTSPNVL
jgi:predicted  nucleic acid-binding Zn-ribbon protein